MSEITHVIFYSLIGGVGSLIGGFYLLSNKKRAIKIAQYATPFAAGALLSAAFIDLLDEAATQGVVGDALMAALIGILIFFLLERFLHWFHHHHDHSTSKMESTAVLVIIGDTVHNFIDGIAIAAGFLVNVETGIVVTIAVAAHEIPQEIGDFGLLLKKGLSRRAVIWANVASAVATVIGATLFFELGQDYELRLDVLLGLVAGFFIYIAVSDIIPMIHKQEEKKLAGPQTILLLVGAIVVGLITTNLHHLINPAEASIDTGAHSPTSCVLEGHSDNAVFEHTDLTNLPSIEIALAADVNQDDYNLEVMTKNFIFTPKNVNCQNVENEGYAQIYINGEKVTRIYSKHFYLGSLQVGDTVSVSLTTNDHRSITHDGQLIQAATVVGGNNPKINNQNTPTEHQ